jgi:hypothetical protein
MFNSKNFNPNAGSNIPKIMNPGTHYCRIVDIRIDRPPYSPEKEPMFVVLTLEGIDRGPEFQGIAKDKMNPARGNYSGQIANVRSGRYPFTTYNYDGRQIKRDDQIFRWINNLAKQLGVLDKMNADNVEADTIEEYVEAVKKYVTDPELWAHHTIGGQEYFTDGYDKPNYRLFYPKNEGKLLPFSAMEDEHGMPVNFVDFDPQTHVIVKEADASETVSEFGGQANPMDMAGIAAGGGQLDFTQNTGVNDLILP